MNLRLFSSTRAIDLLLLLACIVGFFLLISEQSHLSQRQLLYKGITSRYGEMDVGDETDFVVKYVPSNSPHGFSWRVFCPANLQVQREAWSGATNSSSEANALFTNSSSKEIYHSVSFEFLEGYCQANVSGMGGSTTHKFGSVQLGLFLESHWTELKFELLGSDGPVRISSEQTVPLFNMQIPDSLRDTFEREVDEVFREDFQENSLFQIWFGTPAAFAGQNGETNP